MSEHKVVNRLIHPAWISSLCVLTLAVPPAFGKKTVGEVLQNIERQKKTTALPTAAAPSAPAVRDNLQIVKPPSRSTLYYDEATDEGELEKVTDQGINQLYKLTQQFRSSKRRGELWLRLAELYVEKARLIEYQNQSQFEKNMKAFQAGEKKTKPKMNVKPAQDYNRKAIQLYEWFLRDFPTDPKVDQALFFLGYNYFELGDTTKGKSFYEKLSKEHPRSPFVDESNFALGEFYFENEKWAPALEYYEKVSQNRKGRLYSFALYKSAWSQYKMGQTVKALGSLELVIRAGRGGRGADEDVPQGSNVSRIRLANEALRDLVVFYAEAGAYKDARSYFEKVAGSKNAFALTEKLAYYYVDIGKKEAARYVFKELIDEKPNAPKAYDYQYQIVTMYGAAGNNATFREELYAWIQNYGNGSSWSKANSGNKELIQKSRQLIETTLRNFILQQHQTAQNSHAPEAQKLAREGYQLYFDALSDSKRIDEMHFFYGELLFDMKDYEKAAEQYTWVAENAPNSKYFEKATVNAILALEKKLPKPEEIKKIVGETTEPVPFTESIESFETASLRYFKVIKKGEDTVAVKYRMASLYYYFNQFDKAIPLFEAIIRDYPKSQYAEYSANLLLDTYNLKKDYEGLETAAQNILKVPELRNSKAGEQIKSILQKTNFKKAQELEKGQDFAKSAATYEDFAQKNGATELGISAYYNAGVNYEKAGDLDKAAKMYVVVVHSKNPAQAGLRKNASKFLAAMYEKTGQYAKAAEAFEQYAGDNPKDKEAIDFYFNAAVIFDGLNDYKSALRNYQKFFDTSRKSDRLEALFLMAKVSERRNSISQAISYFKQYLDGNPRNAAGVLEASYQIAVLSEKSNRQKQAEEFYNKTIAIQKSLNKKSEGQGASFAAEARFKQVYKTYEAMRAIRIGAAGPRQSQSVQEKLNYLNKLKEEMKSVIKYDDGYQIVAALVTMGQAYQHMAASLYNAPVPKGLDAEGLKAYQGGIDKIARPFGDEAKKSYLSAIEKGQKLESYNEYINVALRELSTLEPEKYHDYQEHAILTKLVDNMDAKDSDEKALLDALEKKSELSMLPVAARILGKDQSNKFALNALAIYYFQREKYGLAKIILNRALKDHDQDPALHNNLGVIFLSEGNQRKAIAGFKRAIDLNSDSVIASTNLASIYLEYKDYSRALPPLESGYARIKGELRKGNKDAVAVANNFALALSGNDDNKKAKQIYKDILDVNPRNATVLANYAILLIEKLKDKSDGKTILNKLKFATSEPALEKQAAELEEKLKGL